AAPAATVTETGTVSAVLSSDSATAVAIVSADETVTVQFDVFPDVTVDGLQLSPVTVAGVTVTPTASELPFNAPVTVTHWSPVPPHPPPSPPPPPPRPRPPPPPPPNPAPSTLCYRPTAPQP